jgi:hypothetical protein
MPDDVTAAAEVRRTRILTYRKIILLVDSPEAADALTVFPGLRVAKTEQVGRMSITHWVR